MSVDMMFGLPGQSIAQWAQELRRVLDLGTSHLSLYELTVKPGTKLYNLVR